MSIDELQDIYETPSGTPDFKTELANQLSELIPEAIADGKVDVEKLKEILGEDAGDDRERFGLSWAGKKRALRAAQEPTTATLKPDYENSKDWDTTKNVFIEGDNLEVLKILQKHYHGKIKVIYIDPPYNTGRDFVYPDNYKEGLETYLAWTRQVNEEGKKVSTNSESEGRYHSNWLNMMYPRLKLARNLLTEDGVIFISIDNNEQAHLKKVCDEVFGESNFVDSIIWKKTENIKMDSRFLSQNNDYILCYRRSPALAGFQKEQSDVGRFNLIDEKGKYYLRKLDSKSAAYRPTLDYVIEHDGVRYFAGGSEERWRNRQSGQVGEYAPRWLWSKNKFEEGLKEGEIVFKNGNVYNKVRFDGNANKPFTNMPNIVSGQTAQKELDALFGKRIFDHPKPPQLISWLINLVSADKDLTVLDFFSGSGTTAHSVMRMNAMDGGSRKHIQVQLPEPTSANSDARRDGFETIADIARHRIRTAGAKIQGGMSEQLFAGEVKFDGGFRSYALVDTNFTRWRMTSAAEADALEQHLLDLRDSADDDATPDSLLTELLLKQGYSLTEEIGDAEIDGLKLKSVGEGLVLAYLDEHTMPTLQQLRFVLASKDLAKFIILEDAFQGDDELKTNLVQEAKTRGVELWTA
ncbi:site-specific DNA-methyltransferase [Pseudarthrobacter enclensis]|uniref:site-specific DNA-methyltransferase n=1 Tax=Pseudarthrobacter enclensis TaxID=993070 RepID=UPI003425A624